MKPRSILLTVPLLFVGLAFGQKATEINETGHESFEADFPAGGELRLDIRSGELVVKGIDENKVRVHFAGSNSDQLRDVAVRLKTSGSKGELHVSGGPRNNFRIVVEVPKVVDLHLRMPFGEATVEQLTGSKDVEIHAGDLTVEVGEAGEYGHVDASVLSGDLEAGPFSVSKSGLFRSFEKQGGGRYRLHAHVGAGDLTLEN